MLHDSRAAFARIRDAGRWSGCRGTACTRSGRFADVRAALRDDSVFRSGAGVAANPLTNRLGRDTTLFSDDDTHIAGAARC